MSLACGWLPRTWGKYIVTGRKQGEWIGKARLRQDSPKRADNGGNYRGFEWNFVCEGCRFGGESSGFRQGGQAGKWAEKVAEIEFFQDGNHAENGHLSTDKVTKCSGKVFALKKTATE